MLLGACFGLVEFLVAVVLVLTGSHITLFGLSRSHDQLAVYGTGIALLTSALSSSVFMSVASYLNRAVPAFGMYGRVTTWSAIVTVVSMFIPAFAVSRGANITAAAFWQLFAVFLISSAQTADLFTRLSKVGVRPTRPHKGFPLLLLKRARYGYAKNILEQVRQQGVRVVLALLTNAANVTVFATTRTISNIMLQVGLTLTNPIIPELSSMVREKKTAQISGAFTLVWIVLAVLISPGALILAVFGGNLFHWWTHGKLVFDHWLLATLIASVVLTFAFMPAMLLARSQNDFARMTRVMLNSAVAVVITMVATASSFRAVTGGLGLLAGEAVVYVMITAESKRLMSILSVVWPAKSLRLSQVSLAITLLGLGFIAYAPHLKWAFFAANFLLQLWLAKALFLQLSDSLRSRLLSKMPLKR